MTRSWVSEGKAGRKEPVNRPSGEQQKEPQRRKRKLSEQKSRTESQPGSGQRRKRACKWQPEWACITWLQVAKDPKCVCLSVRSVKWIFRYQVVAKAPHGDQKS